MFHFKTHFSLKKLSRIHTGGVGLYFALVYTVKQLIEVVTFARDNALSFYVLGAGSNVILSDNLFKGIVIKLDGDFKVIEYKKDQINCGAGASLMKVGFSLAREGFNGYGYMAVIPGTIGGATLMNAGTGNEGEIKDHFIGAKVLDSDTLEIQEYSCKDMNYGYRKSEISKTNKIVLNSSFKLDSDTKLSKDAAINNVRQLLRSRRVKQPRNPRTFGSTFKQPSGGKPAGWYLDRVGMKGVRVGGAMVAEEHANWILNVDGATSNDVKSLIHMGQKRVLEQFGVGLKREVIYLPEDLSNFS